MCITDSSNQTLCFLALLLYILLFFIILGKKSPRFTPEEVLIAQSANLNS